MMPMVRIRWSGGGGKCSGKCSNLYGLGFSPSAYPNTCGKTDSLSKYDPVIRSIKPLKLEFDLSSRLRQG